MMECSIIKLQKKCKMAQSNHYVCVNCSHSHKTKSKIFKWQPKVCKDCIHNQRLIKCKFKLYVHKHKGKVKEG